MLLCNVDRNLLSVAGLVIAEELSLLPTQSGVLQSAYLWGYGLGQLPSGLCADRWGGPRTLLAGLVLWSLATVALPLSTISPAPFATLLAARALFGLGSAVALPATSATVAMLVPLSRRAFALSIIYGLFNVGSLVGLNSAPALIGAWGWPSAFAFWGALGLVWSVLSMAMLPRAPKTTAAPAAVPSPAAGRLVLRPGGAQTLAALIYVHCVIGWGYFLLLSWIPTYLRSSMGAQSMGVLGLLSSLPWAVCAVVGVCAGGVADALLARGWQPMRVRTVAHAVATLGPAAAIALLPLAGGSVAVAVCCLCVAMGAQALNYAGFHAHAGAVGRERAGLLLAVTNSGGIVMGIAGNIVTGVLLQRTGDFNIIFLATAVLYLSSLAVWLLFMRDEPVFV